MSIVFFYLLVHRLLYYWILLHSRSLLYKHSLLQLTLGQSSGGSLQKHSKHLHNGKVHLDFKNDTFPHYSNMQTVWMWLRSGEFKSPLPHIYPVWQHFISEVDLTRKSGHTSVKFSQLSALQMGYNISWLCYDTMTQDSCFGSVAHYYLEFLSTCASRPQATY